MILVSISSVLFIFVNVILYALFVYVHILST